jgi:hypothetical protein
MRGRLRAETIFEHISSCSGYSSLLSFLRVQNKNSSGASEQRGEVEKNGSLNALKSESGKSESPSAVTLLTGAAERVRDLGVKATERSNIDPKEAFQNLKGMLEAMDVRTIKDGVQVDQKILDFNDENGIVTLRLLGTTKGPDGAFSWDSRFQVPLTACDFERAQIDPVPSSGAAAFKLTVPTANRAEAIECSVIGNGTGSYEKDSFAVPEKHRMTEFGFSFNTRDEAEDALDLFKALYGMKQAEEPIASDSSSATPSTILGSNKQDVDKILTSWTVRQSRRSTIDEPIFYYGKDVEIIVKFRKGSAVGVAVIDRPGVGISPIPKERVDELVLTIGGIPRSPDVLRDAFGVREFSVGDAD